jgi:hypothetical protein
VEARPPNPVPRSDSLALPSDTGFRFGVLVFAVVSASLFVWNALYFADAGRADQYGMSMRQCVEAFDREAPSARQGGGRFSVAKLEQTIGEYRNVNSAELARREVVRRHLVECQRVQSIALSVWQVERAAAVLGLAFLLYLLAPVWNRRRHRLRPLSEDDDRGVLGTLHSLAKEAGLRRPPAFVWDPLDSARAQAFAFGALGRHSIALSGGLVTKHYSDPQRFRVTLLHEMAHLRNRDIGISYFSVTVGLTFLGLVLYSLNKLPHLGDCIKLFALGLIVAMAFISVLHARERFADARVANSADDRAALVRVLASMGLQRAGWRKLLSLHPSPVERARLAHDPTPLLKIDAPNLVLVGSLVGFSYHPFFSVIYGPALGFPGEVITFLAALPMVPLLAGVLVVASIRAVAHTTAARSASPAFGRTGLLLGAGFAIGFSISLTEAYSPSWDPRLRMLWTTLVVGSSGLFVRFMGDVAEIWGSREGKRTWIWQTALAVIGALTLTLWYAILIRLQLVIRGAPNWAEHFYLLFRAGLYSGWSAVGLVALSLLPLAGKPYEWMRLLRAGVGAGFVYAVLLLPIRLFLRRQFGTALHHDVQFDYVLGAGLIQAGVAFIVAFRSSGLATARGIFAATAAGVISGAGLAGLNVAFQVPMPPTTTMASLINVGVLFALPATTLGAHMARAVRLIRSAGFERKNSRTA